MNILEDGAYISVVLKKFLLPEEMSFALSIPSVVESLCYVKVRLTRRIGTTLILIFLQEELSK